MVAQVHEGEVLAVLAAPGDPAAHRDALRRRPRCASVPHSRSRSDVRVDAPGSSFAPGELRPVAPAPFDELLARARRAASPSRSVAHGHGPGRDLRGADDQRRPARPDRSATFSWAFMRPIVVERSARSPRAAARAPGPGLPPPPVTSTTKTSGAARVDREDPLGVAGEQQPLDPAAEADARGRRARRAPRRARRSGRRRRSRSVRAVERRAGELEGRARVVVEAPDEPVVEGPCDARGVEALEHPGEVRRRTARRDGPEHAVRPRSPRGTPAACSRGPAAGSAPHSVRGARRTAASACAAR